MGDLSVNGLSGRLQSFMCAVESGNARDIKRQLVMLETKGDERVRESCIQAIHTLIEEHDFSDIIEDVLHSQVFKKKAGRQVLLSEIPHFINTAARACQSVRQLRGFLSTLTTPGLGLKLADDRDILCLQDQDGLSALHLAVIDGELRAAKLLLDLGSECVLQTTADGNTSLSLAIAMDHPDLVSLLLPVSDVNTSDMDGDTPLMYAAWRRQPALVLRLIQIGADVNAESAHGTTALWNAVFRSCPETVLVLLQHNARMAVKCEGTRLFRAREGEEEEEEEEEESGEEQNASSRSISHSNGSKPVEKIYRGHKRSLLWVAADRVKDTHDSNKSLQILLTLLEAGYDVTQEEWLRNISENVPKKFPNGFMGNQALKDVLSFFRTRPQTLRDACRGVIRHQFVGLQGQCFADWLSDLGVGTTVVDYLSLKYLSL